MSEFGMPFSKEADIFAPTAPAAGAESVRPTNVPPKLGAPDPSVAKPALDAPRRSIAQPSELDVVHQSSPTTVTIIPSPKAPPTSAGMSAADGAERPEQDPAIIQRRVLDSWSPVKKTNTGLRSEGPQLDEFLDFLHNSVDFRHLRPDGKMEFKKIPKRILDELRLFQLSRFVNASAESKRLVLRNPLKALHSVIANPERAILAYRDMFAQANLMRKFVSNAERRGQIVTATIERVNELQKQGNLSTEIAKLRETLSAPNADQLKALEGFLAKKL